MILVADSGSTKTAWLLQGNEQIFQTQGLNPFFVAADDVIQILRSDLPTHLDVSTISEVWFYGAGCSSADRSQIITAGLSEMFPQAKVQVEHDLLAAARATCGTDPGLVCIVGTGANTCRYNGKDITHNIPALGFILGDEASASWLGKHLVRDYLYGQLPQKLNDTLADSFNMDKDSLLDRIYKDPFPNVYLPWQIIPILNMFAT